jgi:hypothetical protein
MILAETQSGQAPDLSWVRLDRCDLIRHLQPWNRILSDRRGRTMRLTAQRHGLGAGQGLRRRKYMGSLWDRRIAQRARRDRGHVQQVEEAVSQHVPYGPPGYDVIDLSDRSPGFSVCDGRKTILEA